MLSGEFYGLIPPMAQRMMGSELMGRRIPPVYGAGDESFNDRWKLPENSPRSDVSAEEIANLDDPIPIAITMAHMAMFLNGRPYGHDDIQPRERIPVDTTQLIDIFHEHGGGRHGHGP